jgi:sulfotransferase
MKEMIKELIREEMNRMNKTYYFMSGLPRSGSTLLSSILNQNPRFYSGPSSPVVPTMITLENSLSNDELFLGYPKVQQAKEIIASVLPQYYSDRQEPVIFDKNRSWTIRMEYIPGYFDIAPKVLCPVRDIAEILTSFISMIHRNPYHVDGKINFIDEMLVKNNIPLTDDNRCEFLASPNGILGQSVEGLRKALMEGYDNSIHLIEYKDIVNNPKETMEKIYEFLEEEPFEHTFDNLENINRENDGKIYGFADMHEVRSELKYTSANPEEVLSEEILEKCKETDFWRINETEDETEEETEFIGG